MPDTSPQSEERLLVPDKEKAMTTHRSTSNADYSTPNRTGDTGRGPDDGGQAKMTQISGKTGHSPPAGAANGGGQVVAAWVWEAAAGPGEEDPFMADWAAWGEQAGNC